MRSLARTVRYAAGFVLVLSSSACGMLSATPVAWSRTAVTTPSSLPALPPTAFEASQILPTSPPGPTPGPSGAARPQVDQPWVVFTTAGSPSLSAWDGSSAPPLEIPLPGVPFPADLSAGAHPLGAWLAVRTAQADGSGLTLQLVDLNNQTVTPITPLLNPDLEAQAAEVPRPEAIRSVNEPGMLAWSPNGRLLAFTAAVDGPSSDLYLYDLVESRILRLTRGIRQAATPFWSSDSQWVLIQEVESFGSGAGWQVTSVWAASIAGNDTRKLYTPPQDSGGEVFLAWTGAETVATYTWTPAGSRLVRETPLNTRWLNPLFAGPFDAIAFDPAARRLVFTVVDPATSRAGLVPGIYTAAADTDSPEMIQVGDWRDVRWLPSARLFLASGVQGALMIPSQGEARLFPGNRWVLPSPDGLWIVGWGDGELPGQDAGVRLYDASGRLLQEISADPVQALTWYPDSKTIIYRSGDRLYRAAFPDTRPVLVASGLGEGSFALVPAPPEHVVIQNR